MRYAVALVSLLWAAAPAFASDPTDLIATGRSDTQLYLQWDANGNTLFTVDYLGPEYPFFGAEPACSDFPPHNSIFETSSDPVTIEGLQPFTWYHIHVHAIDPATHQEVGDRTNVIIVRTRAAGSGFEPVSPGSVDYIFCNERCDQAFTDHPLSSGTFIKRVHITELRTCIDDLRDWQGLAAFSFTDPTLTAQSTMIKAIHITDLRTALAEAYSAADRTPPTYTTDPTLVPGVTVAKAAHISEIRIAADSLAHIVPNEPVAEPSRAVGTQEF